MWALTPCVQAVTYVSHTTQAISSIATRTAILTVTTQAPNALLGLITFGTTVQIHELGYEHCAKSFTFKGTKVRSYNRRLQPYVSWPEIVALKLAIVCNVTRLAAHLQGHRGRTLTMRVWLRLQCTRPPAATYMGFGCNTHGYRRQHVHGSRSWPRSSCTICSDSAPACAPARPAGRAARPSRTRGASLRAASCSLSSHGTARKTLHLAKC